MFIIKNDKGLYFSEEMYAEYGDGWSRCTASVYYSYEDAKRAVATYHEDCDTKYRYIYEIQLHSV